MMERFNKIFLLLVALLANISIYAYDFEVDGIYYNIVDMENLTCEVTFGDNEYTGKLVIPETVIFNGRQLTVVGVGDDAFRFGTLTSVTIPHTVIYLDRLVFNDDLEELILLDGEDVLEYNGEAFEWSEIKTLYLGRNMRKMGNYDVSFWENLTSLTIGKYVTKFSGNGNASGGFPISNYFDNDIETMVISDAESVLIMDFRGFPNLKTVYIGRNINYDDSKYHLFSDKLTSASIGSLVTVIPNRIFYGCSGLTSITIPNSVTAIGSSAFSGCSGLTSITIPNSVTAIGSSAFVGCSGLTSITIPNSVTEIGSSAFWGCSGLTSVTLPNSITEISSTAFVECSGLTSITIPNSVTEIGWNAFSGCSSLTHLTIGNSVKTIDIIAFSDCDNLTVINSLNLTPPSCDLSSFENKTYINATLYVPEGTLAAYQEADGWKNFWNIKEGFEMSGVAVHTTDANVSVTTNYGSIEVAGVKNGAIIDVYNTNGQLVYKGTETTINVPTKGIYIVRVAGQSFKVII